VPEKIESGTNFRDILAVATTASSIATMAATIANILK
jgi:hypothetical protein